MCIYKEKTLICDSNLCILIEIISCKGFLYANQWKIRSPSLWASESGMSSSLLLGIDLIIDYFFFLIRTLPFTCSLMRVDSSIDRSYVKEVRWKKLRIPTSSLITRLIIRGVSRWKYFETIFVLFTLWLPLIIVDSSASTMACGSTRIPERTRQALHYHFQDCGSESRLSTSLYRTLLTTMLPHSRETGYGTTSFFRRFCYYYVVFSLPFDDAKNIRRNTDSKINY